MGTKIKPRIRTVRTEMDFNHQGKILTAAHPFYGPENSKTLKKLIMADRLREPTASETVSFAHEYFLGEEPQAQEVTGIMKERYFRGFTGVLFVPENNGKGLAHFINYPEFDGRSVVNTQNLIERIGESYAQVSFEYLKEGVVPWNEVAKQPYFVAFGQGKEGAEKLAELVSKHPRREAYAAIPNLSKMKNPESRVAVLYSAWGGFRLLVDFSDLGDGEGSCAFGVSGVSEANDATRK